MSAGGILSLFTPWPDITSFWFWYIIAILLVIVFTTAWLLPQILKFQALKRKSFSESVKKGVTDEPKVVRILSEEERKVFNQTLKKNLRNAVGGFALSLVLTYFLLFTYIQTKEVYPLLVELAIIVPELMFFCWWLVKNYNGYIERQSPVCCVKGSILFGDDTVRSMVVNKGKKDERVTNVEELRFVVRSIRFALTSELSANNEPEKDTMKLLKSLKNGDIITVEYTMFLNQVLQIQKL